MTCLFKMIHIHLIIFFFSCFCCSLLQTQRLIVMQMLKIKQELVQLQQLDEINPGRPLELENAQEEKQEKTVGLK